MAALDGAPVGGLGSVEVALLAQQDPEVEGGVAAAAGIRAAERLLGAERVVAAMQQDAERAGPDRVPALVRAPVGGLGPGDVAGLLEQRPRRTIASVSPRSSARV